MIGVAVSYSPYGGYKDIGIVYNKDGYRPDSCSWDAQSVHNPHIKRYNGKYYLYYCATVDPGGNAHVVFTFGQTVIASKFVLRAGGEGEQQCGGCGDK